MENIKEYFEEQRKQKDVFNIFKVLHKEADEKYLHSRFISYLLSSNEKFLELFLEILGIKITDFEIKGCKVRPNKQKNESELEYIDILIFNEKQAIIVENKIFAGDSNRPEKKDDGYDGQLERYYNTITTGKNKDGIDIGIGKKEVVCISYLTLDGHEPTPDSLGNKLTVRIDEPNKKTVKLIDYTQDITGWLNKCIEITPENLLASIYQYKKLVQELASDVKQAKENQKLLSDYLLHNDNESALNLKKYLTEDCFEVFKHIQWHTVDDFFNELEILLLANGACEIQKPALEDITKITHKNGKRAELVIKFKYNGVQLQIVNDNKNGFTLGKIDGEPNTWRWDYFSTEIKNIKFCDFSNNETFSIINEKKREEIIAKIVEEVEEKYLDLIFDFKK